MIQGVNNTTTSDLATGNIFTGTKDTAFEHPDVMTSCLCSQDCTLYYDFSVNGTDWDTFPTYGFQVKSGIHSFHQAIKGPRYFRVRLSNSSGSTSTVRLYTWYGTFRQPNSPLNQSLPQDSDASLSKSITEETLISLGLLSGYSVVNKFGRNPSIASGSVPEDIWNNSTVYAGFPTGSPEELKIVLSDAGDVGGIVTFQYLATSSSTAWQSASITTTGTTTNTGITAYRVHTAQYLKGNATGFNAGTVTIQHVTTTANIFIVIPIGTGQSYSAGYTVPTGSTAYMRRLFARVYNNTAGSVEGALWVRQGTTNPRLRRPFSASNTYGFEEQPYGGLVITGPSDIMVRITGATASVTVIAGYDLIQIRN